MKPVLSRKWLKRAAWLALIGFLILNVVAFFHAYKFTHFTTSARTQERDIKKITWLEKARMLFTGIDTPRPVNLKHPGIPCQTITLNGPKKLECWHMQQPDSKGTVILFHGYRGSKDGLIREAEEFYRMGYNTLLVDFRGSGGSEGDSTTIGFKEAEDVKICFDAIRAQNTKPLYLHGSSMGAVAIMRAVSELHLKPDAVLLECPFGTMYQTVVKRFELLKVPSFPAASLLAFWGGVQHGFWAYSHNPVDYARNIHCPVLLLFGELDDRVTRSEIDTIYSNLSGSKQLHTFPQSGHESYLKKHREAWLESVASFLEKNKKI